MTRVIAFSVINMSWNNNNNNSNNNNQQRYPGGNANRNTNTNNNNRYNRSNNNMEVEGPFLISTPSGPTIQYVPQQPKVAKAPTNTSLGMFHYLLFLV